MSNQRTKNLIKYVVPTMLGSICFFLFTIIDGVFIGHGIGTNGLGAINLVMPFVMVVNAVFMLTTIGGVTIVAIRLGRGDKEGSNQAFMHSVIGSILSAVILCVAGALFGGQICTLLGASGTFHQMAVEYLFWYSVFIIPSGLSVVLQGFCRNDGSPGLVSVAVVVGTVCNIFGDWLLIFPIPMGLKGAAIATGVSQTISFLIVLTHYVRRKGALYFHVTKLEGALFKKILVRGLPESISQLATPVMTLCMNMVLVRHIGDIGINAFSIISYVASFSIAVFMGSSEGLQPLFGQSYGAGQEEDLKGYFHAGLSINFIGSLVINVLLLFVGDKVCALFGADADTLRFAVRVMPQFAWGFVIMSLNVMISAYLYSTKRSAQAIVINILRSLVVNSAVILLLPAVFGSGIIWYTFGIYETLVLAVSVVLLRRSEKNGAVSTQAEERKVPAAVRIITVDREFGSGGRELGKRLADALKIPCYDQEIIEEVAKQQGLDPSHVGDVSEADIRKVYAKTVGRRFQVSAAVTEDSIQVQASQHNVIRALAGKGDCVIVGRCADMVLKDMNPLNLFVYADQQSKLLRCRERAHENESEKDILRLMQKIDRDRIASRELMTDSKWGQKETYHLCINTSGKPVKLLVPAIAAYAAGWFEMQKQ